MIIFTHIFMLKINNQNLKSQEGIKILHVMNLENQIVNNPIKLIPAVAQT